MGTSEPDSTALTSLSPENTVLRIRELYAKCDINPAEEMICLYKSIKEQTHKIQKLFDEAEEEGNTLQINSESDAPPTPIQHQTQRMRLSMDGQKLMHKVLQNLGEMEQKEIDQALQIEKIIQARKATEEANQIERDKIAYLPQYKEETLPDGKKVMTLNTKPLKGKAINI